jgi:quercetin dioxygenase-like cupin family protein
MRPTEPTNLQRRARRVSPIAIVAALVAIVAAAQAADAPQPKRTILAQHDQSGVDGYEVILGTAELPAGTTIDWHIHHGDESGYVLKGTLVLRLKGQPDRTLKAGDFFFNPAGAIHSLSAPPGGDGGTALSTWIVVKGKPLAEPAT